MYKMINSMKFLFFLFANLLVFNVFAQIDTVYWDGSTDLKYIYNYKIINGEKVKNGEYVTFHFNGQPRQIGFYENNEKHQHWQYFSPSGVLLKSENYKNGVLNGDYLENASTGKVLKKARYQNGELDGQYLVYYENGFLKEDFFYENGHQNGLAKLYYPNGSLQMQVEMRGDSTFACSLAFAIDLAVSS